jgi:membrane protein implicated in regulation of membrane protease activity
MTVIFTVCFAAGLLLALVMAVSGDFHLGHVHHAGGIHHAGGAQHAGGVHHGGGGHHVAGDAFQSVLGLALSWLSPVTLAGGALLFGGVGLLLRGQTIALPAAVVAAVIGAFLFRALMAAFVRASSAPLSLSGEGAIATVNATIRPGSAGEVGYTLEGLHRSAIARSEDGIEIPRGTQVVITRRDHGIAWVEPLDPIDQLS